MNSIKHTDAANKIGCTRNHINYLIKQGYLERIGYGAVTEASLNNYLKYKDEVPIVKRATKELSTTDKNIDELWTEITELKRQVSLLIELFDVGSEDLELDEMRANYLAKGAANFDAKSCSIVELREWARICISMSLINLKYICDTTNTKCWYDFHKLCYLGCKEARYLSNTDLLVQFQKALKNMKELCLLLQELAK